MSASLLLTAQPRSMGVAIGELRTLDNGIRIAGSLSDGVAVLECGVAFDALARACMQRPPIFAQHMCPNDAVLNADATPEAVCAAARPLLERARAPVAVQMRYVDAAHDAPAKDVLMGALDALLASGGLNVDNRHPVSVLSVCAARDGIYVGVSEARHNLCARGGRAHGYGRLAEKISRSELKLLEALELFDIALPGEGRAADLGAAPGGWTHALTERGLAVDAVDPAPLHASLYGDALVEHRRMTAQAFLPLAADDRYDALVNDMKMDARPSAALMLEYRRTLKRGGVAIMTLKLPEDGAQAVARAALRVLSAGYTVTGARQLYNNRSEITVVLRNDG